MLKEFVSDSFGVCIGYCTNSYRILLEFLFCQVGIRIRSFWNSNWVILDFLLDSFRFPGIFWNSYSLMKEILLEILLIPTGLFWISY